MELSNFARIGKGVISKIIGLQENYTETYIKQGEKRDEFKSGCHGCPVYQAKCQLRDARLSDEAESIECKCMECADAVNVPDFQECKKYINEKNMYGYQETLKSFGIKLLLAYHFMQPDAHGLICDVSIKELAGLVGCTVETIKNNNRALMEYGYIHVCNSGRYDGCINVILAEYKDYHKTAEEGGRGYLTLSSSIMWKLLGLKGVNALRMNLKGLLLVDNASYRDLGNPEMSAATTTYKSLQGFLPDYCRKNVIIKAMQQDSSIFSCEYFDKCLVFRINQEFAQKNMRSIMMAEEEAEMKEFTENLNMALLMAGDNYLHGINLDVDSRLAGYRIAEASSYTTLQLCEKDYKDLAALCVQYNREIVQEAVITAYNEYTLRGTYIKNFGGLARTLIRIRLSALKAAA